jgi:spore coat-associated protein N
MFRSSLYQVALFSLVVTGLAGSYVAVESLAVFSDETVNAGNTFGTGTVSISDAVNGDPAAPVVTFANMAPGDVATGPITISNDGTLDLRYAMTSDATNDDGAGLRDQLVLEIRDEGTGCGNFDGAQLYAGPLSGAAFGNPVQGHDAGDRMLAAAASEVLCFRVELPLATGNAYQGTATTATFTFHAE